MSTLTLGVEHRAGATIVRPVGRLDLSTYRELRDGLLKQAVAEPTAVVVLLDDEFEVAAPAVMAVFATVRMRVSEWPGVPLLLVAESARFRRSLNSGEAGWFVPRFNTLERALKAVGEPAECCRDETALPASLISALLAREFVRHTCERWRLNDLVDDAVLVASELVENAVRHAHSAPRLRLELRGGKLAVAVRDDQPTLPRQVLRQREPRPGGMGIPLVAAVSRVWGHSPWPDGGKVVWAVLEH